MRPESDKQARSALLPKEVGKRLELLRTSAGLSQEAVALLLGLDRRTGKAQVSKMETGHYRSGPGEIPVTQYRIPAVSPRPALTSSPSGPNIPAMDTAFRPDLTGSGNSIVSPFILR